MAARFSVVHVYKGFPPVRGGIEGHVALLTRLLSEREIACEVLCASAPGAPRTETSGTVHVHRCVAPLTLASTPLPPLLPVALWRSRADIIHLHYPWPPAEVATLLSGGDRPLVVSVHCEVVRHPRIARVLAPLTQALFARAARIIVSGPSLAAQPVLARHSARVRVVPFGVDLDVFSPNANAIDPAPWVPHPRILFVGRLRHYKGLRVLAAALARLPHAQLVVAGDGPERQALIAELDASGCRDRAYLLGEVSDDVLLQLLQTADVLALPSTSRAESFGLSVAEAQACGLPAVTTDVGTATTYTIADGLSGRVVPPNDVTGLAEALAWCVEPTRSTQLRAGARAHAEAYLCGRRMVGAIADVYRDVLHQHRQRPSS